MEKAHHKIGKFLHHHCFCERGILRLRALFVLSMVAFFIAIVILPHSTKAAALNDLSDTMSRLQKNELSNHTIRFTTPTGAGDVGDTIEITMPAGFNIGTVDYTDIDLSHGAATGYETEETLAGVADGTSWGASFGGQVLSLEHPTNGANGDIALSDKVVVEIGLNAASGDQQINNNIAANSYIITIGGDFGDSGSIAIVIVDDDQVDVTANIDPTITFTLSANATAFGTLSPGIVDTSAPNITLTIGTNAASGYTIGVRDAGSSTNPGLYKSAAPTDIIGSADDTYANTADLSAVAAGYGLQASSATATIAARYDQSGDNVGGLEITDTTLASYATALASDHTITIVHKARSGAFKKAGSYSDTLTYIATANF